MAIRKLHQIGFSGEIALAGDPCDEVVRGLHAVSGLGESGEVWEGIWRCPRWAANLGCLAGRLFGPAIDIVGTMAKVAEKF